MASFSSAAIRSEFRGLRGIVHLNSASMGAPPASALAAVERQLALLGEGPRGRGWGAYIDDFESPVAAAHREARALLHAGKGEAGLIQDTTSGLHAAIDAIPFATGDNVVLSDLEYPQVALAARNASRETGVEIRFVRHRSGRLEIDDYRAAIDRRTRAILVSSVGWVTGQRMDLAALSELAAANDSFLVVDAVQQLGALDLDCSALRIDFLMAGGYKWLNAPFACGVLYVRRAVHDRGLRVRRVGILGLEEPACGWGEYYGHPDMVPLPDLAPICTVRRFEAQGTPNRVGSAGFAAALAFRNALDPRGVDAHVLALGAELIEGLRERRARVLTPASDAERAGIVTFTFGDGTDADAALRTFLESRDVFVSTRYCSGVGGVRVAVHYFNVREDLAAFFAAIDAFRTG
jgi:cysteine desulfurase / selenocysteine lyase